MRRYWPA